MGPHTYATLRDVMRQESRSLLQYVADSYPWTTWERQDALRRLQNFIAEERAGAAAIGQYLLDHHLAPPYLGAFPTDFTTINYVSLDHLLPLLAEAQRSAIARLEADLRVIDDAGARALVLGILETKRRHLAALESGGTDAALDGDSRSGASESQAHPAVRAAHPS